MQETGEILAMISNDKAKAVKEFSQISHENIDQQFIDIGLEDISLDGLRHPNNRAIRNELIRILQDKSDLSKRSIAYVLDINRETVRILSREPSNVPAIACSRILHYILMVNAKLKRQSDLAAAIGLIKNDLRKD